MIELYNLTAVGKFQKTHALKGELNALLDISPEYFEEGNALIVNVEGTYVPFYAESIRGKGVSSYLIKIKGLDSHDEARELVNEIIYAEKEPLREFMADEEEELFLEDDLAGFTIIDREAGDLGVVDRIDDSTANVLLVIKTEDGSELYIPFADDFILGIDENNKHIETSLPEELINLNKKKDE